MVLATPVFVTVARSKTFVFDSNANEIQSSRSFQFYFFLLGIKILRLK